MIIYNNILGLNAFKELSKNERKTTSALEKLSSGLRINNAADDAAGLSISERMRAQIRGLSQAARNIQDGINYMDTAEGFLSSIHTPPLERLRQLAVQAATDTLSEQDREAIQAEVIQNPLFPYSLNNFGGNALSTLMSTSMPMGQFPGTAASASRIYGAANVTNVTISAGVNDSLTVRVNNLDHTIVLAAKTYTQAQLVAELNSKFAAEGIGSDIVANPYSSYLELRSTTIGTATTINSVSGNSVNTLFRNVYQYYSYATLIAPSASDTYIDGRVDLKNGVIIAAGTNDKLAFDIHNDGVVERKTITLDAGKYTADSLVSMINQKLQDQNLLMSAATKSVSTPLGLKTVLSLTYSPGKNGSFAIDGVGGSASYIVFYPGPYDIVYDGGDDLKFHVGANSGNTLASGTQFLMNMEILGLETLDLTTTSGASQAIDAIDDAVDMVSSARGLTGAKRNALEAIYRNVTQSEENLQAAESLIRDADIAKEMVEYTKLSVLSQAAAAMLAQANKQPQMILELLK